MEYRIVPMTMAIMHTLFWLYLNPAVNSSIKTDWMDKPLGLLLGTTVLLVLSTSLYFRHHYLPLAYKISFWVFQLFCVGNILWFGRLLFGME